MHSDRKADDELQARKPYPGARQAREREGALRIAEVHRDLEGDLGHASDVHPPDLEIERSFVDEPSVPLGTGNGDFLRLGNSTRRVARADHRGNAELARDNGGMTGTSSAIRHDRGGALHRGLPVRVRHLGDQHIAGPNPVHLARVADRACPSRADSSADAATLDQHPSSFLQAIAFESVRLAAADDGLRPCLENVEASVEAILAPLDIHRPAVVLLDDEGETGQMLHVPIVETESPALRAGRLLRAHPVLREHHSARLGAEAAPQDRGTSRAERRLEGAELVRVHLSLDERLPEPPGRIDEHDVGEARFGIQGEHHSARPQIATHHALHARGQGELRTLEAVVCAVGNRPVGVERSEDPRERGENLFDPAHVQQGFLLAGERGLRQVLRRRGRAHRDAARGFSVCEIGIGPRHRVRELESKLRLLYPTTNPSPALGERVEILDVETGKLPLDALLEPVVGEKLAICESGGRETARHPHSSRAKIAVHLPEGSILPSGLLHIFDAERIESDDVLRGQRDPRHLRRGKIVAGWGDPSLPMGENTAWQGP